jgi:hypothetical protein
MISVRDEAALTARASIGNGANINDFPLHCSRCNDDIECSLALRLHALWPLLCGNSNKTPAFAEWTSRSGYFNMMRRAHFSILPGSLPLRALVMSPQHLACSHEHATALVIEICSFVDEIEIRIRELGPRDGTGKFIDFRDGRDAGNRSRLRR